MERLDDNRVLARLTARPFVWIPTQRVAAANRSGAGQRQGAILGWHWQRKPTIFPAAQRVSQVPICRVQNPHIAIKHRQHAILLGRNNDNGGLTDSSTEPCSVTDVRYESCPSA